MDVSKRGGSGESKEQQLLKSNGKIHDHSYTSSLPMDLPVLVLFFVDLERTKESGEGEC